MVLIYILPSPFLRHFLTSGSQYLTKIFHFGSCSMLSHHKCFGNFSHIMQKLSRILRLACSHLIPAKPPNLSITSLDTHKETTFSIPCTPYSVMTLYLYVFCSLSREYAALDSKRVTAASSIFLKATSFERHLFYLYHQI